ncbi:MAG: excinuclease ABC subunit UvrA [Eubacteriales bacterium]|nr:excinuclease ABC subunit UvrA [Eubacteriales bacterium]
MHNEIVIKGAKENNLKNVDLVLPRDHFIVFTGLSGSGKSTLAFDTIYAEGQRRYVESLSAYARQFLGQMEKPNVEYIDGLSPAISIDQKTTSHNPRSTVGTVTEIYDFFRLLFARVGELHCHVCGQPITQVTVQEIVDEIMKEPDGTRLTLMSPIVRGQKGTHKKLLENIEKEGYVRVRVDGTVYDIADDIPLAKNIKHHIEVIVDRIKMKPGIESRLHDSIESAVNLSGGLVSVDADSERTVMYTTDYSCPDHGLALEEVSTRMFSFNAPYGACPRCKGLGENKRIDPELVVPNPSLSLKEGAVDAWGSTGLNDDGYYSQMILALAKHFKVSPDTPWCELPEAFTEALLYGTDNLNLTFTFDSRFSGRKTYNGPFEGVIPNLQRRYEETASDKMREKIDRYMIELPCPACHGQRLRPEVLAVTVGGKNIIEVTAMNIRGILDYLDGLELGEERMMIAKEIIKEIKLRLGFLRDVGLGYLTLDRKAGTLSGGEAQRIRLATQIGSALVGVLYVLDEPSIGLHQRDNDKLIRTLKNLTALGNTLIVVEHDEDTIRAADFIVDIGPYAGIHGGEIVAAGPLSEILKHENSLTAQYLSGKRSIPVPEHFRPGNGAAITLKGARENNLKNIDVSFPLGKFICVTGVSGSGKSTLVNDILYKALAVRLNKSKYKPGKFKSIEGYEAVDKIINIDQSPIGRTPRSNPATYTKVFDPIRELFAATYAAKAKGYRKGRFSFNVKGGRCEACKGDGIKKIEMHFLPDIYVPCEVCKGMRYNRETLNIRYKDKSIADVLDMNVDEAYEFFENIPAIEKILKTLRDVGLNYIKLGQPSTQLSGGEAQRIKLAAELCKRSTGRTLYILDEPTTGLHIYDVDKLLSVLHRLADGGNTVIVIEHNLDVIKTADHLIDLGPEGGDEGGRIVFEGTPKEIVSCKQSYTGEFLKRTMKL